MARSSGRPETVVALIDGVVARNHPALDRSRLRFLSTADADRCGGLEDGACRHGTCVAGLLAARRSSSQPGICPGCTLLVRPVFGAPACGGGRVTGARPEELAAALTEVVDAGARVINLSLSVTRPDDGPDTEGLKQLAEALERAASRGVLTVVAAGNQGTFNGSVLTRHPATIPVVACTTQGGPMPASGMGTSVGQAGLRAPGEHVRSLGADGRTLLSFSGTSAAAPFVTGTIALLCSEFPRAVPAAVRYAVTRSPFHVRRSVVPPLLDAWAAYATLSSFS